MGKKYVVTRPPDEGEIILRRKFYESLAGQPELMDRLGERLLTLELAIPGLYAAVIKLLGGEGAVVNPDWRFYLTIICWLTALLLTLAALLPKKWQVDEGVYQQAPEKMQDSLGMQDFFESCARYKFRRVLASSIFFFAGTLCAFFTTFIPG